MPVTESYQRWQRERVTLGWFRYDPLLHPPNCPLCLRPLNDPGRVGSVAVWDHCHGCALTVLPPGSFRGFLCQTCNRAEGYKERWAGELAIRRLLRDKEWQQRATAYRNAHLCSLQPRPSVPASPKAAAAPPSAPKVEKMVKRVVKWTKIPARNRTWASRAERATYRLF